MIFEKSSVCSHSSHCVYRRESERTLKTMALGFLKPGESMIYCTYDSTVVSCVFVTALLYLLDYFY